MNLFQIASKHGIPEEKADTSTSASETPHCWAMVGDTYMKLGEIEMKIWNTCKSQYDELLKGLVRSEENIAQIVGEHHSGKCSCEPYDDGFICCARCKECEDIAKALANSTEIVTQQSTREG